ncbi:hypothetical protein F5888DRAFT_1886059 [Russula emetica]|nr:hypothetical protein F5888DRAFT_1886059 [Russula emetica]
MHDLAQINLFMRNAKEDRVRDKISDSKLLPHHVMSWCFTDQAIGYELRKGLKGKGCVYYAVSSTGPTCSQVYLKGNPSAILFRGARFTVLITSPAPGFKSLENDIRNSRGAQMARWHISLATYGHERLSPRDDNTEVSSRKYTFWGRRLAADSTVEYGNTLIFPSVLSQCSVRDSGIGDPVKSAQWSLEEDSWFSHKPSRSRRPAVAGASRYFAQYSLSPLVRILESLAPFIVDQANLLSLHPPQLTTSESGTPLYYFWVLFCYLGT